MVDLYLPVSLQPPIVNLLKTAILSWLQNDGTRGFSIDQLKGKQLLLTFQPGDGKEDWKIALKTIGNPVEMSVKVVFH